MEKLSGVMISFRNFTFQDKWASDCVGIFLKKYFLSSSWSLIPGGVSYGGKTVVLALECGEHGEASSQGAVVQFWGIPAFLTPTPGL